MTYEKIDSGSIEITHKQRISKADIESEKQTIEERLGVLNEMLGTLNK